ncbi:MAG: alpha-ketoglutarate-dependent dioxygenase AlkB [Proteobacteria bacterium]|nr:alpha-ketoglutarate-dependent dioxygenase AlkB [Pseudomonadota bacterium]
MRLPSKLEIAPGIALWPGALNAATQEELVREVFALADVSPFYRPVMPKSGKPFSVEESNFGSLGWVSTVEGYRYAKEHPLTHAPWPAIPEILLALWDAATGYRAPPECCLVNLYGEGARMGLHQDRDERALDAAVVSVSLGDDALFRIGGDTRKGATRSFPLKSGDVVTFGGPARLAFHGIDRIVYGSSRLIPQGGRLNLTLRRVTPPEA